MNPVLKLDRYPIPKVEDLFVVLAGRKLFSKIDLSQAYQQLPLDEEIKAVCMINTHKGLFCCSLGSHPGILQHVMEHIAGNSQSHCVPRRHPGVGGHRSRTFAHTGPSV